MRTLRVPTPCTMHRTVCASTSIFGRRLTAGRPRAVCLLGAACFVFLVVAPPAHADEQSRESRRGESVRGGSFLTSRLASWAEKARTLRQHGRDKCRRFVDSCRTTRQVIVDADSWELVVGAGVTAPLSTLVGTTSLDSPSTELACAGRARFQFPSPKILFRDGVKAWLGEFPKQPITPAAYFGTLWGGYAVDPLSKKLLVDNWGLPLIPGLEPIIGGLRKTFDARHVARLARKRPSGWKRKVLREFGRSYDIGSRPPNEKLGELEATSLNLAGAQLGAAYVGRPGRGHQVMLNLPLFPAMAVAIAEMFSPGMGSELLAQPWVQWASMNNVYGIIGIQFWRNDPEIENHVALPRQAR